MGSAARTGALVVAGLLVAALAAAGVVVLLRAGEVLPDVTLDGSSVSGLGREDLVTLIEERAGDRAAQPLVLRAGDVTIALDRVELGAAADPDALAEQLLTAGREDLPSMVRRSLLGGPTLDASLVTAPDETDVEDAVVSFAEDVDVPVFDGSVSVDPITLAVEVQPPADGLAVDVGTTTADVVAALAVGADEVAATTQVRPAVVPMTSVDEVAAQAARAVAESLTLTGNDAEVVLDRRAVAALISSRRRGIDAEARLELAVAPQDAAAVLTGVIGPLLREPVSARFDPPRVPPVGYDQRGDAVWRPVEDVAVPVVPGVDGAQFDPGLAAAHLEQVLTSGRRSVALRLAPSEPELTTASALGAGVDTLLSTFTTYHACCQGRVRNIQTLADTVDGTVVPPGGQFSINELSGVRTCESGYAEAGMILDGEIVDVCGGGVSQFGTTTVNALFFSGLDPDAYQPHSFYISRYPMAREATLNFPSPDIDVRFTNAFDTPIVIRTAYTATSITVSFYGSSDVAEVRADLGTPTSFTEPTTRRRVDRSLPPGTQQVVQSGARGFRVGLERTVVLADGSESVDDWSNTYRPVVEVVLFNPDPAPAPEPSPTPSPTPTPTPEPDATEDAAPSD